MKRNQDAECRMAVHCYGDNESDKSEPRPTVHLLGSVEGEHFSITFPASLASYIARLIDEAGKRALADVNEDSHRVVMWDNK